MLDAYESIPILEKLPLLIESITTFDDNLLIGTKQGHLLMYSVISVTGGEEKLDVQLSRSNKYFSKRPILQLEAVPEFQILISLSDNVINVHDMTVFNFPLLFTIDKTRGASLFALDNQKTTSLTGKETCTLKMCVVVKKRLLFFYWKNKDKTFWDLTSEFCVPDIPKTVAWCVDAVCVGFRQEYFLIKLTGEQTGLISTNKPIETNALRLKNNCLALCKDDTTLFLNHEGNPNHKNWITWSETPLSMEHDSPYILGVVSNQIEVRTFSPRLQIQDLKLNRPKLIKASSTGGRVFVASGSSVWCLLLTPVDKQISELVKMKHFELALQLVNIKKDDDSISKTTLEREIRNMYALNLFCKFKFEESMEIFLALETDPVFVIGLFPELLPEKLQTHLEYPDIIPKLEDKQLENGLLALISYLTQVRHSLMKELTKNNNQQKDQTIEDSVMKSKSQLHQIVDTTLVKCYLKTNNALVASLLRLPDNNCHVEETEIALKLYKKYNDLITLYRCKEMHEKALELLYRQAYVDDSPLKGCEETVKYLQHLGKKHLNLIFSFAKWVLKDFPDEGLKIFADDVQEVESLPREHVFSYLVDLDESLVIPYLEYVIIDWKDESTHFHNALVLQYLNKILKLTAVNRRTELTVGEPELIVMNMEDPDGKELRELQTKLNRFLETSTFYVPEMLLVHFPLDYLFEERAILLGKLGLHEQALAVYILVLKNSEQAEAYCLKNYNDYENNEVYLILLKMYLCPPDKVFFDIMAPWLEKSKPNLAAGLKLLREHPSKIDPLKAIEMLPPSIPLREIQTFLEQALNERIMKKRNCQILKGLLHAEQLQVHEQRISCESHKIIIEDINTCAECKKRINVSAFIQYPNGKIVHFYCRDKYQSTAVS